MSFDSFENLSKIDFNHPAYLCKIRAIADTDDAIFQELKEQYSKINQLSNGRQRLLCTLICSILLQERLYFATSKAGLNNLMQQDPNLGEFNEGVGNQKKDSWANLLAWLYNDVQLIELVQQGKHKKPSVFKIKKDSAIGAKIVEYLLSKGIDHNKQKEEALNFIAGKDLNSV